MPNESEKKCGILSPQEAVKHMAASIAKQMRDNKYSFDSDTERAPEDVLKWLNREAIEVVKKKVLEPGLIKLDGYDIIIDESFLSDPDNLKVLAYLPMSIDGMSDMTEYELVSNGKAFGKVRYNGPPEQPNSSNEHRLGSSTVIELYDRIQYVEIELDMSGLKEDKV